MALYEPININYQTMAGSGQKMFYLKAGIPSILPALPDFIQMVNKYRFGIVADARDIPFCDETFQKYYVLLY